VTEFRPQVYYVRGRILVSKSRFVDASFVMVMVLPVQVPCRRCQPDVLRRCWRDAGVARRRSVVQNR